MVNFKMSKSVYIYTYGCQMNEHDTEKMIGVLTESGYSVSERPEDADLVIFNTCAIRAKAEQKFYSQLGRTKFLKKKKKNLRIAVAGCVAQDARERIFRRAPYVDLVIGPQNIPALPAMISERQSVVTEENPNLANEEFLVRRESRLKAWISIMYGCNNFCSYCIVPYTRGREISRPSRSIIGEARTLQREGYKEITLLGQNVNSYRSDLGFVSLLKGVSSVPVERVRFVTSHPRDLGPDLADAVAGLPNVCEHIHLPLQSGSDRVLGLMNRGYTLGSYWEKIEMLRRKIPGVAITTDIIAGFPGETEKDAGQTEKALKEIEFDGVFAFKYSPRVGTLAYSMDGHLPEEVKSERLNAILKIQEEITLQNNRRLEGSIQEILVESPSDSDTNLLMGRTRTNKIVTFNGSADDKGKIILVRIARARHHSLLGEKLNNPALSVS